MQLTEDWRYGCTFIDDIGDRREAYNVMLSMPRGTDPLAVQRAAREFAKIEGFGHSHHSRSSVRGARSPRIAGPVPWTEPPSN